MDSLIQPNSYVVLRLPSGLHKVVYTSPDTVISLGKFGTFHSNSLLERPFYVTYEVKERDKSLQEQTSELRLVSAEEIHAETLLDESSLSEARENAADAADGAEVVEKDGVVIVKDNRQTVDDPTRQGLSMAEIENLKKSAVGSGKDIVTRIMESHSAIGEKTAYSLAKYIVRKSKKYMKRFTALPLDVTMLAQWMLLEREASKVLDIREEVLGLIASWSNVHCSVPPPLPYPPAEKTGRWLVVEDTAGLIVALLAERMGLLHLPQADSNSEMTTSESNGVHSEVGEKGARPTDEEDVDEPDGDEEDGPKNPEQPESAPQRRRRPVPDSKPSDHNSITLVHSAAQPNLSLLTYFSYDQNAVASNVQVPALEHPLNTHLKTLNWLQLLSPDEDTAYSEPEFLSDEQLKELKSNKRGAYYRKRRRWQRAKHTIDETRAGGFDGLVVASMLELPEVMHHLVPLLKGGAPVVVYAQHAEPLAELMDIYSSARRTAFIGEMHERDNGGVQVPSEDYPLDPRLLLAPMLQTARAREWQVLPGRTHPLMTSPGGPEGFLFTATRVVPSEQRAEARGNFAKKKRKTKADPEV